MGDRIPLVVKLLSDDDVVTEHVALGELVVDPPTKEGGGEDRPRPPRQPKNTASGPRIIPVYQGDDVWQTLGFTEGTVAKIDRSADRTTAYINMDNGPLNRYRRSQPRRAEEINRVYSLAAAAIGLATDVAVGTGDLNVEPEAVEDVLDVVGRVLAPTLDFVNQNAFATPDDDLGD